MNKLNFKDIFNRNIIKPNINYKIFANKKILVTGSSGSIGTEIIKKLKKVKLDIALFVASVHSGSKRMRSKFCMWNNLNIVEFTKMLNINCFSHIKILEFMMKKRLLNSKAKMIFFSS